MSSAPSASLGDAVDMTLASDSFDFVVTQTDTELPLPGTDAPTHRVRLIGSFYAPDQIAFRLDRRTGSEARRAFYLTSTCFIAPADPWDADQSPRVERRAVNHYPDPIRVFEGVLSEATDVHATGSTVTFLLPVREERSSVQLDREGRIRSMVLFTGSAESPVEVTVEISSVNDATNEVFDPPAPCDAPSDTADMDS